MPDLLTAQLANLPAGPSTPGQVLVGCAGWTIPKLSAARFPPEGSHLERFAAVFGAAEINSSFYRPHRPGTYARWAASTPADFRFSVKLPRAITHEARLVDPEAVLDRFAGEAAALGGKLGCVLVQLPPKLGFDGAVAEHFFTALRQRFGCMLACEARNASWFGDAATSLLSAHGITRVIADPAAGQPGPHQPTSNAIYVRLHGSPRVYYSDYAAGFLAGLGESIASHVAAGRQVWCIFDNTLSPTFVEQALAVQDIARR
ncbi:MAG: DUF72 domain-containing protein [Massilia sp.]